MLRCKILLLISFTFYFLNDRKNEEIIRSLDEAKDPFLFTSDNLIKLLEVTTSLKTKIAIIGLIGPRLLDPKAKTAYFTGLFRFVEDKNAVEEIFKARAQTIQSTAFSRSDTLNRGGRGGGGPAATAGRGPTTHRSGRGMMLGTRQSSMNASSLSLLPTKSIDAMNDSPVISGFDNVLNALDELHSVKFSPKSSGGRHVAVQELNKPSDDENTTETTISRSSSICSYHDGDSNSVGGGSDMKHNNNRDRDNSSPQTDSEQSTPKRYDDEGESSPPQKLTTFTNKSPLVAMKTNPVSKIASRSSINLTTAPSATTPFTSSTTTNTTNNTINNNQRQTNEARKLLTRRSVSSDYMRQASNSLPNSPLYPSVSHDSHGFSTPAGTSSTHPNGRYGTPRRVTTEYQQLITAMSSKSPTVNSIPSSAQFTNNLNYDLVTKCAWALKLSKEEFLALAPEPGVVEEDGELRYSYRELLRRNFAKDYGDLIQTELEKYMLEEDFKVVFQKTKVC